eukprot:4164240-Lingulodinium_polyedra.AAC.1
MARADLLEVREQVLRHVLSEVQNSKNAGKQEDSDSVVAELERLNSCVGSVADQVNGMQESLGKKERSLHQ